MSQEAKPPSLISGILFGISLLLILSPVAAYILIIKISPGLSFTSIFIASLIPMALGIALLTVAKYRKIL